MRAMLYLVKHYGQGTARSSDIAAEQGIPDSYLNQLLAMLRSKGLVTGTRGPQGGHMLARSPEQISIAEVLEALEGKDAMNVTDGKRAGNRQSALYDLLDELNEQTLDVLRKTSLATLAQRQAQLDSSPIMYYI